jgi:hypothetical protein
MFKFSQLLVLERIAIGVQFYLCILAVALKSGVPAVLVCRYWIAAHWRLI